MPDVSPPPVKSAGEPSKRIGDYEIEGEIARGGWGSGPGVSTIIARGGGGTIGSIRDRAESMPKLERCLWCEERL